MRDGDYVKGQDHPKAILSNVDVDLIRDLHEDYNFSYSKLVWLFSRLNNIKISKGYIRDICTYRRRI